MSSPGVNEIAFLVFVSQQIIPSRAARRFVESNRLLQEVLGRTAANEIVRYDGVRIIDVTPIAAVDTTETTVGAYFNSTGGCITHQSASTQRIVA